MEITEAIIHEIEKEREEVGEGAAEINYRDQRLVIDDKLISLGNDLMKLYGRLANSYGVIGSDEDHVFRNMLDSYLEDESTFNNFSRRASGSIARSMSGSRLTTTSYPVFLRYTHQRRDWLLIAMLKLREQVGLDLDTLNLNDAFVFDITNLREAARIDIEKFQNNEQPYLSFIKKGVGSDAESSLYFRSALSCIEYTDAKRNTDIVLQAVDDFCKDQDYEENAVRAVREEVYNYCKERKDNEEPVHLEALSARIDNQNPRRFVEYVRDHEYEVNEVFSPHPSSYRRYKRISGKIGSVSISFDLDDLYTQRVDYSHETNAIIVAGPPQSLVDEINSAKGDVEVDGREDET